MINNELNRVMNIQALYEEACNHSDEAIAIQRQMIRQLRGALVGLVGVDGRTDLEALEAQMRLLPMPAVDRAITIDAIHALLATLPEPQR